MTSFQSSASKIKLKIYTWDWPLGLRMWTLPLFGVLEWISSFFVLYLYLFWMCDGPFFSFYLKGSCMCVCKKKTWNFWSSKKGLLGPVVTIPVLFCADHVKIWILTDECRIQVIHSRTSMCSFPEIRKYLWDSRLCIMLWEYTLILNIWKTEYCHLFYERPWIKGASQVCHYFVNSKGLSNRISVAIWSVQHLDLNSKF